MAIVAKETATIVQRHLLHYEPSTFKSKQRSNFLEVTAEEALRLIKPITFDFLPGEKYIAVDTETFYTGVPSNRMPSNVVRRWIQNSQNKYFPNDFPFCISLSDGTNSLVVYDTLENGFREFKKLTPLLSNRDIGKIGHNIDYDLHMIANVGISVKGRLHDTLHLSKLTRADALTHSLFDVSAEIQDCDEKSRHYAPTVLEFEKMLDSYKSQYRVTDYRLFPHELMTQYTCADTWNAIWAFKELYPRMLENDQLDIYTTESEMLIVAYWMERRGTRLDKEYKDVIIPELQNEVDEAERRVYATAGCTFNINSAQQLHSVLDKLGYASKVKFSRPTEKMLAKGIMKGNPKFDKTEMARLEEEGVPLIKDILQYKASEKLLNTFAIKLYDMHDAEGVVHCNINTIEAKTGRFSISAPSMQNMPRRKDSRVRGAFIAPEGYCLYDFDFKSQESIILVHYSRSQYLTNIINEGGDIHTAVATIIYSILYEEVTKALRDVCKSVEFAIVYGAGPSKVSAMTGLSLEEASLRMKTFLKNCPEVDTFIRTANTVVKQRRMIRTIKNRHVYVERGREYACVNYIIQGSAADSTKGRMVQIHKFLQANGFKSYMVIQVHDSLLNAIADNEQNLLGWLRWLQTERELFRVPVLVDVAKCEPTWRDKKDIDVAAVKPPDDMLAKMEAYDIWSQGTI